MAENQRHIQKESVIEEDLWKGLSYKGFHTVKGQQ